MRKILACKARSVAGFFLPVFLLFFFPACLHKKGLIPHEGHKEKFSPKTAPSLSIEMPENKLVFENVSALLYEALWNHFDRVGYTLVDKNEATFSLVITVKDVDSVYKFLSPDLLTYAEKIRVILFAQLLDRAGNVVAKNEFVWSTLVSKAKDYVENSEFLEFEYCRMFQHRMYKLDQYFRPYLHEKRESA